MNISLEFCLQKFMNANMAFDLLTPHNDQKWIHQTGNLQGQAVMIVKTNGDYSPQNK